MFIGSLLIVLLGRYAGVYRSLQRNAERLAAANRELSALSRLKDDFLSHTSHELRTPLHGISGLTEAMLDGAAGPVGGEMERNLRLVRDSAERLLHLVNDILDLDRLRNDDIKLRLAPVDAVAACETVAAALAPLAARQQLRLSVERTPATDEGGLPLTALADAARLEQMLYNLVGNAIRYTKAGEVRIAVSGEADRIVVSVADSGPGIPPERAETLFEPFGAPAAEYGGGMGLGLPITSRLASLHGTALSVVSRPGEGTTISFGLPYADKDAADEADEKMVPELLAHTGMLQDSASRLAEGTEPPQNGLQPKEENGRIREDGILPLSLAPSRPDDTPHEGTEAGSIAAGRERPTLLLADDEPVNLEVLRHFLRHADYRLITAGNGVEALAAVMDGQIKPDLVLLDVLMPGMTGYDVCRRIRERWSPSELPIILLSAYHRIDRLTLGFDAGANDYLTKPFTQGELLARIEIQLKLAQFHHSLEDLVRRRTLELEEANHHLAGSVRETAEALAEVSVLEERNRIAHDMHDLVGHSLTAAIVQIEAAKKLADRDLAKSVERLNAAGEMVRKGLNDVRRTVRMLKEDDVEFDLLTAVKELIRESAVQTGAFFAYKPQPLPSLSPLLQKVVYHALMEGITNGLRHGRCDTFWFELWAAEDRLEFDLSNNGLPFGTAKPGFGLSAMMERVHLLGGTVRIGETEDGGGCRLRITLPLDVQEEQGA
nr:ATP-binding protein [Cohnella sp. REN36]